MTLYKFHEKPVFYTTRATDKTKVYYYSHTLATYDWTDVVEVLYLLLRLFSFVLQSKHTRTDSSNAAGAVCVYVNEVPY